MRSDVPNTRTEVKELERLRQLFLDAPENPGIADYWSDATLLALYHRTFARRISWKWDALLQELELKKWSIPSHITRWIDWGCGTGIATQSVLRQWGCTSHTQFVFSDRSRTAMQFAAEQLKSLQPHAQVSQVHPDLLQVSRNDVILMSHVLTELNEEQTQKLIAQVSQAGAVLWVEPGTPYCSKKLISAREQLLTSFSIVSPCPHQGTCGIKKDSKDWCHFFAPPPSEIFQDPSWMQFSKTMKIDLRSLPVSVLVAEIKNSGAQAQTEHESSSSGRLLGRPRFYKGHAKIVVCDAEGISEKSLQERHNKEKFKEWQRDSFYVPISTSRDSD
ncbi:MAG: hypothetical protein RIR26_1167 [Pseudomonadota bacterium]|jgi:ribosomal protein RSM22 (predicted rRNA methylase)